MDGEQEGRAKPLFPEGYVGRGGGWRVLCASVREKAGWWVKSVVECLVERLGTQQGGVDRVIYSELRVGFAWVMCDGGGGGGVRRGTTGVSVDGVVWIIVIGGEAAQVVLIRFGAKHGRRTHMNR